MNEFYDPKYRLEDAKDEIANFVVDCEVIEQQVLQDLDHETNNIENLEVG